MNGPIYQLLALALAVQAEIRGASSAIDRVLPLFEINQHVRFVERPENGPERVLAGGPIQWAAWLVADRTCSVTIHTAERTDWPREAMTATALVARRRIWTIETFNGLHRYSWTPETELGRGARDAGSQNVWRLTFVRRPLDDSPRPSLSIDNASADLRAAVTEARELALVNAAPMWVETAFDPSLQTLDGTVTDDTWALIRSLVADEQAQRLLLAALKAWVFGGMGSWNDGPPGTETDRAAYDRVTEHLYLAVDHAIVAAVNANDGAGCGRS